MALDILDVVELGRKGVVHIDDDDLPVGLLLIEQGHDTEDLDLLDLAGVANELTDLADVERVIVTLGLGLGVDGVGVLPGLHRKEGQGQLTCEAWNWDVFEDISHAPGGMRRSSTGNPCGGSSCARIGACPS